MNGKLIKGAVCIAVPAILLMLPVPQGLTLLAWQLLAVYLGAVLGIILKPVSEPVVLLTAMTSATLFFKQIHTTLNTFSKTTP